jgi:hypothetical protein
MDLVSDVSVDKDFSGFEAKNGFGRDSRICTSNPEIFGALGVGVFFKIIFVFGYFLFGPLFVVFEDFVEVVHRIVWGILADVWN